QPQAPRTQPLSYLALLHFNPDLYLPLETMSKEKLEGLVKRMEVTLVEMEQLKLHCGRQSEELSQLVVELRRENQELTEKYSQLAQDMKEAKEIIEQLQDTKYAFDAKERQAQKLSRQL
ncbi:hypothetical protein M9458_035356, partial [Cirrhinus mrigala]